MASTPNDPPAGSRENKAEIRRQSEQDVLMREVDEAVRQDQLGDIVRRYGVAIGGAVVGAIALFGAWLWWQGASEKRMQQDSQELVLAIDQIEAGNLDAADAQLAALAQGGGAGAAASARMLRAGIALQRGDTAAGAALYREVANDNAAPREYRDIALIRAVTAEFDTLEPQAVIDQLGPLAVADSAWFGSAGELVAMAYLRLNQPDQAGPLLAAIAQDETVPATLRARTRQLAGVLGVDAVQDVEATLQQVLGDAPAGQELQP